MIEGTEVMNSKINNPELSDEELALVQGGAASIEQRAPAAHDAQYVSGLRFDDFFGGISGGTFPDPTPTFPDPDPTFPVDPTPIFPDPTFPVDPTPTFPVDPTPIYLDSTFPLNPTPTFPDDPMPTFSDHSTFSDGSTFGYGG
jgi:hypothetical protein